MLPITWLILSLNDLNWEIFIFIITNKPLWFKHLLATVSTKQILYPSIWKNLDAEFKFRVRIISLQPLFLWKCYWKILPKITCLLIVAKRLISIWKQLSRTKANFFLSSINLVNRYFYSVVLLQLFSFITKNAISFSFRSNEYDLVALPSDTSSPVGVLHNSIQRDYTMWSLSGTDKTEFSCSMGTSSQQYHQ